MLIIADVVAQAIDAPEASAAAHRWYQPGARSIRVALCVGVVLLVPLSPLLNFGNGPVPGFGIAGGGMAVVLMTLPMLVLLAS